MGNCPLEIEVEVAVLIGQELSGSGPIGPQQGVAAIALLYPAPEVVCSRLRLRQRQSLPALTALADLRPCSAFTHEVKTVVGASV